PDHQGGSHRQQQQDAPHQVMNVSAAKEHPDGILAIASPVSEEAGDTKREKEAHRCEEHPLPPMLAEVPAVECCESVETHEGRDGSRSPAADTRPVVIGPVGRDWRHVLPLKDWMPRPGARP